MIVEFFSAEICVNVCRYRSWRATGDWAITSAASFNCRDAFCSPSAAMTLARASRLASASAAIDRCIDWGKRTSVLRKLRVNKKEKEKKNIHFDTFDFHTPWSRAFIEMNLHVMRNSFSISENFLKRFGAENISQCCLSK